MRTKDELVRLRNELSPTKQALLQKRLRRESHQDMPPVARTIPVRPPEESPVLSFMQEQLWFLQQLEPENTAYNEPLAVRITGPLNIAALTRAVREIVSRHEVLRTIFPIVDTVVRPVVQSLDEIENAIPVQDLRDMAQGEREASMQTWAKGEIHLPFQLAQERAWRIGVVRLDVEEYVLLLVMHHIITDAWSLEVLVKELTIHYGAACADQPSSLSPLPLQYTDYACWQRHYVVGEVVDRQIAYWREQLAGAFPMLNLPVDMPRPVARMQHGRQYHWTMPAHLSTAVYEFSRREAMTPFITLLAAFAALLYRYTGQEDIIVGTSTAGRSYVELEQLLGCFVNTLPLRMNVAGKLDFRQLLGRVREVTIGAFDHQDVPFEKLIELLSSGRTTKSASPLQTLFVLQNVPLAAEVALDIQLHSLEIELDTCKFDIALVLQETKQGLHGYIEYNTGLFASSTIERMLGHYLQLLERAISEPTRPVSELPMLQAAERQQLLIEWNARKGVSPEYSCLHQYFEMQVRRTPQALAVIYENERLSYTEVNQRANQLAHYLRTLGVGPEVLVGICIERSPEMIIAVLGILKAGGAYVPLDPTYPAERQALVLAQARLSLVVTQQSMAERFPTGEVQLVCLDRDHADITAHSTENPATISLPESLAYVIFTSGSTGTPKGVAVSHENAVSSLLARLSYYKEDVVSRFLLLLSLSFDGSVAVIFWTLSCGGTLVLPREHAQYNIKDLLHLMQEHQVSHLLTIPSLYRLLVEYAQGQQLASLRAPVVAGEACPQSLVHLHYQKVPSAILFNEYGLTEGSVWSSVYRCTDQDSAVDVPIGLPIDTAQLYVLDEHLCPLPVGIMGELYIGGIGVARGYLNSAKLTAGRFIPHPYSETPGERLYKTGDLARFLPDGVLQFFGRIDRQVKIRGFRIETGEIEYVINLHSAVQQCVVIARNDSAGEKYLVAYIVLAPQQSLAVEKLQHFLDERLPAYMHPFATLFLERLPLMPNGKVNYALLPEPDMRQAGAGTRFVAPRDPVEETLAGIWASVLGIEQIGVYHDFFLSGGHSLLAARTIARIRDVFGIELSFQELIESSTIAQLAEIIKHGRQSVQALLPPPLQPGPRDRPIPLAFAQQRQWLQHQLDATNTLYTLFGGLRLRGLVQTTVVEQALQEMIHRHETLRTTFNVVDGQPVQNIASSVPSTLTIVDVQAWPEIEQEAAVQRLIDTEKRRVIDLAHGPLLHVTLLRLTDDDSLLLFTSHHIIFDGWSVDIFLREFATLYVAFARGEPSPLPALPIQYADYSLWQQNWLQGQVLETLLAYWKEQLAHLPVLMLPADRPRPTRPTFRAATIPLQLCPALTTEVKEFCRREGVTIFMALLAVFQCILSRYSGQYDIVVGSPVANRGWTEVEDLIGSFMNTQVLRTNLSGNPTFRELLGRVRSVAFAAHTCQALPFEILLEQVQVEHHAGRNPLFQALFAFQNTPGEEIHLPDIEVSFLENASETTMFDIDLSLWESEGKVQGGLKYSTDLFDAPIIEHMHDDFLALLETVVHDPAQHIASISYLSSEEQRNALAEWNRTQADYADERCIHELFESQVARTPNAVAAVFHGEQITYQQVDHQANQVAHHLHALGIGAGAMVAVCMDRSLEMIPALLGILKSGAAYVPFEPAFPRTRLQLLLSTLSIPVVITQSPYLAMIEDLQDIPALQHVVCLDHDSTSDMFRTQRDWQVWTRTQLDILPVESVSVQLSSNDIAYVIFTSGSTGMPKGVMVRHQPVINLIEWVNKTFQIQETDRVLFVTSLCFDLSVYDIFGLLAAGGSLEIVANADIRDPECLLDLINQQPITFWDSAPAALQQLVPLFQTQQPVIETNRLRLVFLSGDWIPITLPDTVRAAFSGAEVVSLGGATEATVWSNYFRIRKVAPQWVSIPYGRPIQNAQYYVLDAYLQPCQVGVAGDLYIGGQCLAEGYINEPALTAQKFLPDPFSQKAGTRLYKTGDQARFWSDGTIEFLGRADTQVKIRGFRIETGEIEATLLRHPAVHAATVVARQDETGEKFLVAYVVMEQEENYSVRTLRQYLQEHLPAYMIPSAFVQLEALPLTTQGKVDRQKLPLPDAGGKRGLADNYIAPRTAVEETLAHIWATVLHLPGVGVEDNFFEIGGHSLLSLQLMAQVRTTWQIEMPLRDLFETQTVAAMALRIEQALIASSSNVNTTMPPLDIQAEATLDAAICGKKADEGESADTEPAHIFLSGASGFLGSVLLAELLQTGAATIYCLVRSTDSDDGKRKLRRALEKIDSWQPEFASRIVAVPGDLAQPRLGLSDEQFGQLAQTVDVIYHSGTLVNTVYDYHELKAVNVLGTQEILRLATTGNVKPFHYISTLSVLSPEAKVTGTALFEEESLDLHGTYMHDGYAQSKWVAEKLVTIARARGVPCTIYRPGRITGHSLYGTWPTDDILCRKLKGCIQLGRIPAIVMNDLLEMTPVDYVGRAVVALSRQQQSSGKTFHLCNNTSVSVNELVEWINEFGYSVRQVSYNQWITALKGNATAAGDNVLLPFLSLLPDEVEETTHQEQAARVLIDDTQTRAGLADTAITCPAIDAMLLTTYLSYFVRSGFLPAPIPTEDNG